MNLKPVNLTEFKRRRELAKPTAPLTRGARLHVPVREEGSRAVYADIVLELHEVAVVVDREQALSLAKRLVDACARFEGP